MSVSKSLFDVDTKLGTVRFKGNLLEAYLPERYIPHGCLAISDTVNMLGIFDMILEGTTHLGYYLPGIITSDPTSIDEVTVKDRKYYKLTYHKGDLFIKSTEIVKQSFVAYVIFYEFLYLGDRPDFINYERSASIFDIVGRLTGMRLDVNHVVFEMISAHLHRDQHDIRQLYRHTDMKAAPKIIPLLDVAHAATSTTARIAGSYFNACMDSSMVNASETNSRLEDMLRL